MNDSDPTPPAPTNRIWCFTGAEFDEVRRELRVGGQVQTVEAKPLAVLYELLCRNGEVATRQELLDAVWGRQVVEQSLTTAVAKLRTALGAQGRTVIEAVHGIGYRIGVPIELRAGPEKTRLAFTLRAGDPVPNRPQWSLDRAFGTGQNQDVWLARHSKTGEQRVFKFADTAQRLEALKRESALSRILHKALGDQPGFVRVSEWNFETRPYFIESAYGGPDLVEWAQAHGGLSTLSLDQRIGMVASIARIVAAAHGVGVLHRDIKPTNILVSDDDGGLTLRLVDFGSGRLTEAARLEAVTVTGLGLTAGAHAEGERISGTLRYMAPEVLAGGPPTIAADVYALGILLYQVIVGDLSRSLGAGWENDIADSLLRDDVNTAASADAERRLSSAAALVERLESLPLRHKERDKLDRLQDQAKRLAEQVERGRLRRPWLVLAVASLVMGLIGMSFSTVRATRARDEARRQADIAQQINAFLPDDLLGRGNPAISGKANETLIEAAEKAEPHIGKRFSTEPLVAASIYSSLAQAFSGRSAYPEARLAYDRASTAFDQAEGLGSADEIILGLRRVQMEIISAEAGSMDRANKLISDAKKNTILSGRRSREFQVWMLAASAATQLVGGDVEAAQQGFKAAADIADTIPGTVDIESRFWFRLREAYSYYRLGQWDSAMALSNTLLRQQQSLYGMHHPDTLVIRELEAQVLMASGKSLLAIAKVNEIMDDLISVYGIDHRVTLIAFLTRAASEGMLERYNEAVHDDTVAYRASLAKQGPRALMTILGLNDLSAFECSSGHATDGLAHAMQAFRDATASFGEENAMTRAVSSDVAFCLINNGKYQEASRYLEGTSSKAINEMIADPDHAAYVNLMRAAIANSMGDHKQAREFLRLPLQIYSKPNTDQYLSRWTATLNKSIFDTQSK